jgi:outer membrane protein assembly factor BamB
VLYVGADDGTIYGLDADDGSVGPSFDTGDGVTKGFVFPDLYGDRVYVSTATTVWSLRDEGPVFTLRWAHTGIPGPSIVLYPPGSQYLWVGSSDGRLYQIDVTTGNPAQPPDATFVATYACRSSIQTTALGRVPVKAVVATAVGIGLTS